LTRLARRSFTAGNAAKKARSLVARPEAFPQRASKRFYATSGDMSARKILSRPVSSESKRVRFLMFWEFSSGRTTPYWKNFILVSPYEKASFTAQIHPERGDWRGRVGHDRWGERECIMSRRCFIGWLAAILLVFQANGAEGPRVLPVWPGMVPGDHGEIGPERVRDPADSPTKNAKWITNVTTPTVTVFPPAKEKNTGTAMIVCPGGGYWNLAWDLEGEEVATWLNSAGITGIVLKYRVPRRSGEPQRLPSPGPLLDAQRAISLARSRADEWGINPGRIGIVGFSAGGHLAMATATQFDRRAYAPIDEIDKTSCRPDFAVAVYPGYLVEQRAPGVETNKDVLAPYLRIPIGTPPIFLAQASDDTIAGAENSVAMYLALKRAKVSAELHIYAQGGHGFGVRPSALPCSTWTIRCVEWLRSQGILDATARNR
jgi:acetyl esterase/lipase